MKWINVAALLLVTSAGLYGLKPAWDFIAPVADYDVVAGNWIDQGRIVSGLENAPNLSDTSKWWTGTWVRGDDATNQQYRPVLSLLYWLAYHKGGKSLLVMTTALAITHLLFLFIILKFLTYLLQSLRIATITTCAFALGISDWFGLPSSKDALIYWMDMAEPACSIFYVSSLFFYLRFLRQEKPKWLIPCVVSFIIAILVKEMAYTVPAGMFLLHWYEKKKKYWWLPIMAGCITVSFFAYRWFLFDGLGTITYAQESWLRRWITINVGGKPVTSLMNGDGLPLFSSCAILGCGLALNRRWLPASIFTLVGFGAFCATAHINNLPLIETFWVLFAAPPYSYFSTSAVLMPTTFVYILLVWRFLTAHPKGQLFGFMWTPITYMLCMRTMVTPHAFYLVSLGWAIWLAYPLGEILSHLVATMRFIWPFDFSLLRNAIHRGMCRDRSLDQSAN